MFALSSHYVADKWDFQKCQQMGQTCQNPPLKYGFLHLCSKIKVILTRGKSSARAVPGNQTTEKLPACNGATPTETVVKRSQTAPNSLHVGCLFYDINPCYSIGVLNTISMWLHTSERLPMSSQWRQLQLAHRMHSSKSHFQACNMWDTWQVGPLTDWKMVLPYPSTFPAAC